jgi:hypothetical protein
MYENYVRRINLSRIFLLTPLEPNQQELWQFRRLRQVLLIPCDDHMLHFRLWCLDGAGAFGAFLEC